jgi:hypothetical protein
MKRLFIRNKILCAGMLIGTISNVAFASAPPKIAPAEEAPVSAVEVVKNSEAPVAATQAPELPVHFVSDGTRVSLENGAFSLIPPPKWDVYTGHPSITLLLQVPLEKGMKYQRTIQVASFSGVKYIDDVSIHEFEELIVRKFSQASASVEDFRIRNSMTINMDDGRNGLLFYSEFLLDGVPLMQAHILVTTDARHYMMSFTDLADHFEGEQAEQYLNVAWSAMTSVELNADSPVRYQSMKNMGAMVAGVISFLVMLFSFNHFRAKRKYQQYESGMPLDEDELSKSGFKTMNKEAIFNSDTSALSDEDDFGSHAPDSEYNHDDDHDADERVG